MQYRYRLEGLQDDWIDAQDRRFASFTNLFEGNYTFIVQALHPDADEQWQEARFSFKVRPPWFRTLWAYAVYLMLLSAAIIAYNRYRVGKERLQAERKRKDEEMQAAQDLQRRMLPDKMPEFSGYVIEAHQETSTEVGGDYYDFFQQDANSIMVVCGDATGHGTAAGMLVSITKAGLNALRAHEPAKVLSELNQVVKNVNVGMLRMSLVLMQIEGHKVRFSSAGMPPVMMYRAETNTIEELLISDIPLGVFRKHDYSGHDYEMQKGDCCVMLSDGLPEATNPKGEMLDYEAVKKCILEHAPDGAIAIKENLIRLGKEWIGEDKPDDDITFVVVECN
jgi:serine phosphatase RsbU (regulator of sigma subunit)